MKHFASSLLWLLMVAPSLVGAEDAAVVLKTKAVSLLGGCLVVPEDAHVVITEGHVDAWVGYVQFPDDPRRISWLAGTIASRIGSGNYATTRSESGAKIRYAGFTTDGKRGIIAETGRVQFVVAGADDSDLQFLLSVARRFRTDVPRQRCEQPEHGKPAS